MRLTKRHTERYHKMVHGYDGKAVGFRALTVTLPNRKLSRREFLDHPGAVGILAFTPNGKILLVKQYRYPVGQFTLEIPAGKLGKGEDPVACVRRELEEETGYRAGKIRRLLRFWPTAAFSNEVIHLFQSTDLRPTRPNPDEDEFLEIVSVTPRAMESLIRRGKMHDSKTLIAYLAWKTVIHSREG